LLGAALAGLAIENSMLGAAHAAANPLTSHCGIVHGQAVGLMLPAVIRFNSHDEASQRAYSELAATLNSSSLALERHIEGLLDLARLPRSLSGCGVERTLLPTLATEAARQWTASFNPRPVTEQDFLRLYEETF